MGELIPCRTGPILCLRDNFRTSQRGLRDPYRLKRARLRPGRALPMQYLMWSLTGFWLRGSSGRERIPIRLNTCPLLRIPLRITPFGERGSSICLICRVTLFWLPAGNRVRKCRYVIGIIVSEPNALNDFG